MEKTTEQNKQVNNIKKRKRTITNIDFQLPPLPRRILFILLGVCALAFVIYQVASFGSSRVAKLHTQTAVSRTITRSITVDGIVVREESVLTANAAGTVVPRVENGSKVSAGDAVAEIFASPSTAQYLLELDDVQTQIAYYENIQSLSSGTIYENKDAYNQNIAHSLFELIGCIDRNELSALSDYVQDLSVSVTKKQTVIGKGVDVSARLSSLYRRRDALEGYISTGVTLPADRAGYYVDQADGYETLTDYAAVQTLLPEDVQRLLSAVPSPVSNNVGKLITQFNWYFVCCVDKEAAGELKVGQKRAIAFSGYSGGTLTMLLTNMNEGENGQMVLVFRSNLMNSEIASLRLESAKLCLEEYSGYAVDKTALRTVDGETGVYVQIGNLIRFRKVEIVYADDTIILASAGSGNGYLRQYDEIITEGTDLYDGKIIT